MLHAGRTVVILGWIRKNLEGCENPRLHGKGLTANRSGEWRYRVGDYRLLAKIDDNKAAPIFSISFFITVTFHSGSDYYRYPINKQKVFPDENTFAS